MAIRDLGLDRVGARPQEGFELQILLDGLEKQLHPQSGWMISSLRSGEGDTDAVNSLCIIRARVHHFSWPVYRVLSLRQISWTTVRNILHRGYILGFSSLFPWVGRSRRPMTARNG